MKVRKLTASELQAAVIEYLARRGERVVQPERWHVLIGAPMALRGWEVETVACEPSEVRVRAGESAVRATYEGLGPFGGSEH